MRDGPVRRCVKALARWHWELNLVAHRRWRRLRGEQPYALAGGCGRCARCCEEPSIAAGRLLWYLPGLRGIFLWWQRHVNGFELVRRERDGHVLVFRCSHFDAATRSCDSYGSRPGMCRDYPRRQLWQSNPTFLPGCGYRAVAPAAGRMLRVLDQHALTAAQRDELERKLHLRP